MNILHLTPDFNYSDGRSYYVYLLLKYFKRRGHNVAFCTNGGDSIERVKELHIPVYINKSLSTRSSFIKSINYLAEISGKEETQIVHSHHRYYELLANSLRRNKSIRTVFTALSIVDRRFFIEYKSDRIIAISNCVKDMLTNKFNVDRNRISLIPNFADSEEIKAISNSSNEKDPELKKTGTTVIFSIGRYHREKNFETLLKSLSILKEHRINLILIGEGEDKELYENIIKENSLDVELVSPKRYLRKYFEIADICVLPSVRDPLPGFMLQSGLYKKPFIGSDVDGMQEIIASGHNGLLFEKKNEFELAERIKTFITDKALAERCSRNLNVLVNERFTEDSVIPEIEELYFSLIN